MWGCSGQQRGTLVDLVEGIGRYHQGRAVAFDHGLCAGEQGLAGAVDRQCMVLGIERAWRQPEALRQPVADCCTQLRHTFGERVACQPAVEVFSQCCRDQSGCGMLRLADRKRNGRFGRRFHACLERIELLEGVGLKFIQVGVHAGEGVLPGGRL